MRGPCSDVSEAFPLPSDHSPIHKPHRRYRSLLGERHNKHQQRTATQIVGEDETRKTRNVQHTFKVDAVVAAAAGKAPKDDVSAAFVALVCVCVPVFSSGTFV